MRKIAEKLQESDIPYMVIGGQAVLLYGEPRLTRDIDITLGLDADGVENILSILPDLSLVPLVKNPKEFVEKTMVLPTIDEESGIRVDFIFSFSPYERQALKRVRLVDFEGTRVAFASLEDVIIHKIIAGRPRDIDDAKSILLKNQDYDREYIKHWLEDFGKLLDADFLKLFETLEKDLDRT